MKYRKIISLFRQFKNDEQGLTTVEYSIAGAVITTGVVTAVLMLGSATSSKINSMASAVAGSGTSVAAVSGGAASGASAAGGTASSGSAASSGNSSSNGSSGSNGNSSDNKKDGKNKDKDGKRD